MGITLISDCYIRVPKVSRLGLGNTQKPASHPALLVDPLLTDLVIKIECLGNSEGAVAARERGWYGQLQMRQNELFLRA